MALLLSLGACGESAIESVASKEAALDTGIACSEAKLAWPANVAPDAKVCAGAWKVLPYVGPCYANLANGSACGYEQKTCYTYAPCSRPEFGAATSTSKVVANTKVVRVCHQERECCDISVEGWCPKPPCQIFNVCENNTVCAQSQQAVVDAEVANYLPMYSQQIRSNVALGSDGCRVTFNWLPATYNTRNNDPLCPVAGSYSCDDTSRPKTCRAPANGLDADPGACGLVADAPANHLYSPVRANGSSLAELMASADLGPRARDTRYPAPKCTTCNDMPMETSAQVVAKYDCMKAALVERSDVQYQTAIIGQMKLLHEARGHLLNEQRPDGSIDASRKSEVRGLYQSAPDARANCGAYLDPIAPGQNNNVEGQLQLCDRLSQAHVPALSAEDGAAACIAAGASAKDLPFDANRQKYLDRWAAVSVAELRKAVSTLPAAASTADARVSLLRSRLALLQQFYDAASGGIYAGAEAEQSFWRDVSAIASALSKGSQIGGEDALRKNGSLDVNAFNAYVADQLKADRELLRAAFPFASEASPPLTGAALLYVLRDALGGLSSRAQEVDLFHDLGCRFKSCVGRRTELSELHGMLGALASKAELDAELSASTALGGAADEWKNVFQRISANHDRLQGAVKAATGFATYDPAMILDRAPTALNGTWQRGGDNFAIALWLLGGSLNGQGDVPAFKHTLAAPYDPSLPQANTKIVRVNAQNGCTTVMTGYLERPSNDVITMGITGTDGKCDVPAWYTETFNYNRITPEESSIPVRAFAPIVQANRLRAQRYAKFGRFDERPDDSIEIGLLPDRLPTIAGEVSRLKGELDTAILSYRNNVRTLATTLLNELDNEQNATGLEAQQLLKAQEIYQLSEDRNGLRVNASVDELRFARMAESFEAVMKSLSSQDRLLVQADPAVSYVLTGQNALFDGTWKSVASLAVTSQSPASVSKVSASKGSTIDISVDGNWAPSCAIRKQGKIGDRDLKLPATNPSTGSEGYIASYSGTAFDASSHETSEGWNAHVSGRLSAKACVGVKAEAGVEVPIFGGAKAYGYAEGCLELEGGGGYDWSGRQSNQTGSESRSSAAFSLGIRLPNTPFPEYPAGSLLAVSVAPGGTNRADIRDVKVVQRHTAIFADQDLDLYLVVNDRNDCDSLDSQYALSVKLSKLQPLGDWSRAFYQAMAVAQAKLRSAAELKIQQGRLLPHDIDSMQSDAMLALATECRSAGCDVAQLPAEMTGFFESWVSAELARAERQVEIRAVERKSQAVLTELKALDEEITTAGRKGGLLRELTEFELRAIDASSIRAPFKNIARVVDSLLYPYLRLKYTATDVSPLDALLTLPFNSPVDVFGSTASAAVGQLSANLTYAVNHVPQPREPTVVALAFPRPGSATYSKLWREADAARSRVVWEQIRGGKDIVFPVRIEDLYQSGAGMASLTCNERVPVIHSMGIYVAMPNGSNFDNLNLQERWVGPNVGPVMSWPGNAGPEGFFFLDPDWLTPKVPVLYGLLDHATNFFQTLPAGSPAWKRRAAAGVSPFDAFELSSVAAPMLDPQTGWTVDEAGALVPAYEAEAVVLLFSLDTQDGPALSWIDTCAL